MPRFSSRRIASRTSTAGTRGAISEDRAADARQDFADLTVVRYPHVSVADRMWTLHHSVTSYDAAFLGLAEALEVALVTCDARLARAPGHIAPVEVSPPK